MQLQVKQGREYVLGGKVYKAGEIVEPQDKWVRVLTSVKGPLEPISAPHEAKREPPHAPEHDHKATHDPKRRYGRRDMEADES